VSNLFSISFNDIDDSVGVPGIPVECLWNILEPASLAISFFLGSRNLGADKKIKKKKKKTK
jgi:hypothetical protein